MPDPYEFLVLSAFVWRISSLLVVEDGPPIFKDAAGSQHYLFDWLRYRLGAQELEVGGWSSLLLCVWCMSLWVGFAVAAAWYILTGAHTVILMVCLPFAMSAAAIFFEGVSSHGKG